MSPYTYPDVPLENRKKKGKKGKIKRLKGESKCIKYFIHCLLKEQFCNLVMLHKSVSIAVNAITRLGLVGGSLLFVSTTCIILVYLSKIKQFLCIIGPNAQQAYNSMKRRCQCVALRKG